jgi:hypothetical protein
MKTEQDQEIAMKTNAEDRGEAIRSSMIQFLHSFKL